MNFTKKRIEKMSDVELLGTFGLLQVTITKKILSRGSASLTDLKTEDYIVGEISKRFNVDKDELLKKING